MESKKWNSDVKENSDAQYILYKFLNGNFDHKNPLSYQTILNARPSLKNITRTQFGKL